MRRCVAVLVAVASLVVAAPANAAPVAPRELQIEFVRQDWQPAVAEGATAQLAAAAQDPATTPIADFRRTVHDHGTSYTYTMIGNNPFVAHMNPATTITTYLQPIRFRSPNGRVWNPALPNECGPGASAVTRTLQSPVFDSKAWKFGGTSVGRAQYVDAFGRAMFYEQTKPDGINPGYHVALAPTTLPTKTVDAPAGAWGERTIGCGKFGAVDVRWWDGYVRQTLLPSMAAQGVTGRDLPLFLFGNVAMFMDTPTNCCVLGYHGAKGTGATFQTYAVAMYDTTGLFGTNADVTTVSHEVAEWMADPTGTNPTPPWDDLGEGSGCKDILEVADALSGSVRAIGLNGYTYHVQELAFVAWFFHKRPSPSINGWYSNFGTFTTPADPC